MRTIAAAAFLLAAAAPAAATSEIVCAGEGVSVDLLVGSLDVLSIARAVVTIGNETWSTQPDVTPGTAIAVGQGFQDDRQLSVDLTDDAVNEVLGRLRIVKGEDGEARAAGGIFTFRGKGAFVVDCSEPG